MVTIPTVLAVSEIATNRRVAGGGAYFIISRSFGTSIGGAIGVALYLSQAISIAFYLVAFAEAFQPAYEWAALTYGYPVDARWVSIPSTVLMLLLMLTKGADLGVRALWVVCAVLGLSLVAFFVGSGPLEIRPDGLNLTSRIASPDSFSKVFAICFPAFTGMIAGLGLSGDLKDPPKIDSARHNRRHARRHGRLRFRRGQAGSDRNPGSPQRRPVHHDPDRHLGTGHLHRSRSRRTILGLGLHTRRAAHPTGPCPRRRHAVAQAQSFDGQGQRRSGRARQRRHGFRRHRPLLRHDRRRQLHLADLVHVLHGHLRSPLRRLLPRILRRQSVLPPHLPLTLVHLPSRRLHVRLDDDSNERPLRFPFDGAHGSHLRRSEEHPNRRTRPRRHLPRHHVPAHATPPNFAPEIKNHLRRQRLASLGRRHHPPRREPPRALRPHALDLPEARLRPLHPVHPGRLLFRRRDPGARRRRRTGAPHPDQPRRHFRRHAHLAVL